MSSKTRSLNDIKNMISNVYFSTNNSIKRHNILHELYKHLNDIFEITVKDIDNNILNSESVEVVSTLKKIQEILSNNSGMHIESVEAVVHVDSKISDVLDDLELDSLDLVEFLMDVETEFDVEISDYFASEFEYVNDIINFVLKN